jgi:hypothetical protein
MPKLPSSDFGKKGSKVAVEPDLQAEHGQHAQVGAQACTGVTCLHLVQRCARDAGALGHHRIAELAAQPGELEPLAESREQPLLLRKDDGWFAWHPIGSATQVAPQLIAAHAVCTRATALFA